MAKVIKMTEWWSVCRMSIDFRANLATIELIQVSRSLHT